MLSAVFHLTRPCRGETANGDAVVVEEGGDTTLIALIDALGHGERAAAVADAARAHLHDADRALGLEALIEGLHHGLRGTRGIAVTAVLLRGDLLEACGVGNVFLRTRGLALPFVASPGILGVQVRKFRVARGRPVRAGRLALCSDGISTRFDLSAFDEASPEHACREIFARHAKDHDDATVLIADL